MLCENSKKLVMKGLEDIVKSLETISKNNRSLPKNEGKQIKFFTYHIKPESVIS